MGFRGSMICGFCCTIAWCVMIKDCNGFPGSSLGKRKFRVIATHRAMR